MAEHTSRLQIYYFYFLDISAYFLSYVCLIVLSKGEVLKVLLSSHCEHDYGITNSYISVLGGQNKYNIDFF